MRSGSVAIRPGLAFSADGDSEIFCGRPKRPVPRVTTVELSTRASTGTRIGDGAGGAVRAAASAGDSMREPSHHAPSAISAATPTTDTSATVR